MEGSGAGDVPGCEESGRPLAASLPEIVAVLGLPLFVLGMGTVIGGRSRAAHVFTDAQLLGLVAFELVYGALLVGYLRSRGWRLQHVSLRCEWKDLVRGCGVWLLGYLVFVAGSLLAWAAVPAHGEAMEALQHSSRAGLASVALVAIVNPLFEEGLWLAYVAHGPGRGRPALAAVLSVGARTFVHLYQGWNALYAIAPLGAWYLRYYRRTGRLAPVILAHGMQDLLSLGLLSLLGSEE